METRIGLFLGLTCSCNLFVNKVPDLFVPDNLQCKRDGWSLKWQTFIDRGIKICDRL